MFEFLLFITACAIIVFCAVTIQRQVSQAQTKMKPIKIKTEEKHQKHRLPPRRPY